MSIFKSTLAVLTVMCSIIGWEILDSYQIERYPPLPMGKYEQKAVWANVYYRWIVATPPDYAKVFLPTSGY